MTPPSRTTSERVTGERRADRRALVRGLSGALAAALLVAGVFGYGYIHTARQATKASARASAAAGAAGAAAMRAERNTHELRTIERGFCGRLDAVADGVNRNGAIIYVVLGQVVASSRRVGHERNARSYARLLALPRYQTAIDCGHEIAHPASRPPPAPIPFSRIPPSVLEELLHG